MSDGLQLFLTLQETVRQCDELIDELITIAIAKSSAKERHDKAFAERVLQLYNDGYPVSIARDLAKGDSRIASLRRECEELEDGSYKRVQEKINLRKREIDILREQITREYAQETRRSYVE